MHISQYATGEQLAHIIFYKEVPIIVGFFVIF